MSAFDGQLLEYPFVSIDRFDGKNLDSKLFFLSHCHKDHMEGLLDRAFIEKLQSGFPPSMKLYTSETTRNLMLCDSEMTELVNFVHGIPVNQATTLQGNSGEETLTVTLISAGHCVGSVMFLFEGKEGTVLYTGDFRLGQKELAKVTCLHTGAKVRHIRSLYIDTTFCCPSVPNLPTRITTKDTLIKVIDNWIKKGENYMVYLKCKGRYGYEYIMKEVAKHFKQKKKKVFFKMLKSKFRKKGTSQDVDVKNQSTSSSSTLPCKLARHNDQPIKMMTIVPSSLYFVRNGLPENNKQYIPSQKLWRVVHSMHASYNEIREVTGYLSPENIYPCVPPADCQDIMRAYQRLEDLQLKPSLLAPQQLIDDDLKEHSANYTVDERWKDGLLTTEPMLSPRSAGRHHDKLGLTSLYRGDVLSPPPRRKRKKKRNAGNNDDEKKAKATENIAKISRNSEKICAANVDNYEKNELEIIETETLNLDKAGSACILNSVNTAVHVDVSEKVDPLLFAASWSSFETTSVTELVDHRKKSIISHNTDHAEICDDPQEEGIFQNVGVKVQIQQRLETCLLLEDHYNTTCKAASDKLESNRTASEKKEVDDSRCTIDEKDLNTCPDLFDDMDERDNKSLNNEEVLYGSKASQKQEHIDGEKREADNSRCTIYEKDLNTSIDLFDDVDEGDKRQELVDGEKTYPDDSRYTRDKKVLNTCNDICSSMDDRGEKSSHNKEEIDSSFKDSQSQDLFDGATKTTESKRNFITVPIDLIDLTCENTDCDENSERTTECDDTDSDKTLSFNEGNSEESQVF